MNTGKRAESAATQEWRKQNPGKENASDCTRKWRKQNPEKNAILREREIAKYRVRILEDPEFRRKRYVSLNKYKDERAQRVDALKDAPCSDCGGRFPPVAMDWDHRDPTTKGTVLKENGHGVSMKTFARGHSWEKTLEEIAKCDLVCANCHRVRTHERRPPGRQRKVQRI